MIVVGRTLALKANRYSCMASSTMRQQRFCFAGWLAGWLIVHEYVQTAMPYIGVMLVHVASVYSLKHHFRLLCRATSTGRILIQATVIRPCRHQRIKYTCKVYRTLCTVGGGIIAWALFHCEMSALQLVTLFIPHQNNTVNKLSPDALRL